MKKNTWKKWSSLGVFLILASCNFHTVKKNSSTIQQLSKQELEASSVYLTTDEHQVPVISWVEMNANDMPIMNYAKWDNSNDKFGVPKTIPIPENTSTHEEGMPKIIFKSDGTILAIFEQNTPVPGMRWGVTDLRYMQSIDHGKTWSESKSVIQNRNLKASQSFAGICQLEDGEIGVAWLDTYQDSSKRFRPVRFAKTQGRNGFGNSVLLDNQACECCRVAVIGNTKKNITVAYRDLTNESVRDISIVVSTNNGQSFSSPKDFTHENWKVDGCPHNGPSLAQSDKFIFATWYSGGNQKKGVKFAKMNHDGKVLRMEKLSDNGRFSQLITTSEEEMPVITYCEDYRVGDSIYSRIKVALFQRGKLVQKEISTPKTKAFYPVLRQLDEKNIIVAWKDQNKIYYKRINLDKI